jgi:dCTP deaminase
MFWTTQKIESKQKALELIDNAHFKSDRVKLGAYELSLSRDLLVTKQKIRLIERLTTFLSNSEGNEEPDDKSALRIPPGQFALLYSEETVKLPKDVIAFISIKASIKLQGLVNISGFHVDPDFRGRLKFSVYNAGIKPIFIEYGAPCFLIWFADMDECVRDGYDNKHQHYNQRGITIADRELMADARHSPAELESRLSALEKHVTIITVLGVTIIVSLLLPIYVNMYSTLFKSQQNSANELSTVNGKTNASSLIESTNKQVTYPR